MNHLSPSESARSFYIYWETFKTQHFTSILFFIYLGLRGQLYVYQFSYHHTIKKTKKKQKTINHKKLFWSDRYFGRYIDICHCQGNVCNIWAYDSREQKAYHWKQMSWQTSKEEETFVYNVSHRQRKYDIRLGHSLGACTGKRRLVTMPWC